MKKIFLAAALALFTAFSVGCVEKDLPDSSISSQQSSPSILQQRNRENPDIIGWLTIEGCEINNPLFHGEDNEEYLRVDENGNGNIWGCYFLDYINSTDGKKLNDQVNIIYGHSKGDDPEEKKFSKLKRYKDRDFAARHPNISLELLEGMTTWQVFAATDIPVSIDYIDPAPDREKLGRTLEYMLDNSYVDFEVDVSTEDQILILSTCTSDEDVRFIIAAKLVK